MVLLESGFTWLPQLLWRTSKTWRGDARRGAVDRPAAGRDLPRARSRDPAAGRCAAASDALGATLEHIGSDRMLLFSTDYPHWQFDGDDVLPDGLPADSCGAC